MRNAGPARRRRRIYRLTDGRQKHAMTRVYQRLPGRNGRLRRRGALGRSRFPTLAPVLELQCAQAGRRFCR